MEFVIWSTKKIFRWATQLYQDSDIFLFCLIIPCTFAFDLIGSVIINDQHVGVIVTEGMSPFDATIMYFPLTIIAVILCTIKAVICFGEYLAQGYQQYRVEFDEIEKSKRKPKQSNGKMASFDELFIDYDELPELSKLSDVQK